MNMTCHRAKSGFENLWVFVFCCHASALAIFYLFSTLMRADDLRNFPKFQHCVIFFHMFLMEFFLRSFFSRRVLLMRMWTK